MTGVGAVPASATARRHDEAGGWTEVLGFVGPGSQRIAACAVVPDGACRGAVVVCPSLFNEFLKNARREVELARALGGAGFAVVRLHYRGTGHADGEPTDTAYPAMVADAHLAGSWLAELAGLAPTAYLGTRFGALVAASVAGPGAALALVEPVVSGAAFFSEGLTARLFAAGIHRRSGAGGEPRSVAELTAELERTGAVDVLGYTLGLELHRSAAEVTLVAEVGRARPRPLLVVQLDAARPLRAGLAEAVATLTRAGLDPEVDRLGAKEQWWLAEEREGAPGEAENRAQGLDADDPLLTRLVRWMAAAHDPGDQGGAPAPRPEGEPR